MTRPPRELLEFLYRYDRAVQSLALGLRKIVHEEMAPCHEYIFAMRSKVVLLYGATARVIDDGICHINVFTRHVLLGFSRGAELDDPAAMAGSAHDPIGNTERVHDVEREQRDVRGLEHVAAGVEHEIRRRVGLCAAFLAQSRQELGRASCRERV